MVITGTGFHPSVEEIELVDYDPEDGVRLGLTALPNAAADAGGGLPISDAGGLNMDATDTNVSSILTDTAEIGTAGAGLSNINLPNQTMDITGNLSGSVGSVTGAVGSVAGNVDGNVSGTINELAAQAKTDVNAEVLDVMSTDTFAEPAQGTPAATASLVTKIGFLYKNWRNKKTQTATQFSLFNDDTTTVDHKATVSDDATTATKAEIATGP